MISQVPILAEVRGIDFNNKTEQFKKYPKKILQLKKIEIKKNTKIVLKDKVSLKVINKYQFRKSLNNKNNIPIKEIAIKIDK